MNRKLCDVPFTEIYIGKRVISAQNNLGYVFNHSDYYGDNKAAFKWDDGTTSDFVMMGRLKAVREVDDIHPRGDVKTIFGWSMIPYPSGIIVIANYINDDNNTRDIKASAIQSINTDTRVMTTTSGKTYWLGRAGRGYKKECDNFGIDPCDKNSLRWLFNIHSMRNK